MDAEYVPTPEGKLGVLTIAIGEGAVLNRGIGFVFVGHDDDSTKFHYSICLPK